MQRVSMQLVRALRHRDDVELNTVVLEAPWKGIERKVTGFLLKQAVELPAVARAFKADVILFSSMVTASLSWFVRGRVDVPMVTINHGQDVTLPVSIYQWFVPKVFRSLDGVISVSEATRQQCIRRGMHPDKGVALPNGFETSEMKRYPDYEESRAALEDKFGINLKGRFMLLTVGRQVKRKGHEWFIRNVIPKIENDFVYVTVGDGPETENIHKAVEQSPHRDRIHLLGRQPDEVLKQAYAAADLFIMPNIPVPGDMEGFGIVLLEANLANTPAVAADLEGIKDVIEQGENGYRVPTQHAEAFSKKVDEVLHSELDELKQKCRRYVISHFSWEHVAGRYVAFMRRTIDQYVTGKS